MHPKRLLVLSLLTILFAAATPTPVVFDVTPLQQLYILKELKPDVQRVGILWDKATSRDDILPQIQRAGATAGVQVVIGAVGDVKEIASMFRELVRTNEIDALWIVADDHVVGTDIGRKFLVKSAAEHRIPILAPSAAWVNEGAAIALKKEGDAISLLVNKAAAQAVALNIPDKYLERTQFLAGR